MVSSELSCCDREISVAFTGHRSYGGEADEALKIKLRELYASGYRNFLCGMAVGFDLAAAEAVCELRQTHQGVQLVAVVPFVGQEMRFAEAQKKRYRMLLSRADQTVVISDGYYEGCLAVRNNYMVDRASVVLAWYDGSRGGTCQAVQRARRRGLEVINLHPRSAEVTPTELTLF